MLFLGQSVRAERQLALCSFLLRLLSQIKVKEDVVARRRNHFRLAFGACERLHITPHTRDFCGWMLHARTAASPSARSVHSPSARVPMPPAVSTNSGRTLAHTCHCPQRSAALWVTSRRSSHHNAAQRSLTQACRAFVLSIGRSAVANRLWHPEGVAVGSPKSYMSDALRRSLTTRSTDCIAYDCAAHARRGAGVPPPPFLSGKRRPSTLARSPLCTCAFELRWPKRAAMG